MLFKVIANGYIIGVGIGSQGTEITHEEYDQITELMHNKPVDTEEIEYRLSESMEWIACEKDSGNDEITTEELVAILTGESQ